MPLLPHIGGFALFCVGHDGKLRVGLKLRVGAFVIIFI